MATSIVMRNFVSWPHPVAEQAPTGHRSAEREMGMKANAIRVAIVDDHPLVLSGLRRTMEDAGLCVLGAESSATGLMMLLDASDCDVIVADYSMPGEGALDGWRFLATVASEHPHLPVLVFSEFDDPFLVGSLAQRGIAGFVSKRERLSEVLAAVRRIASGGRYLSPFAYAALERFSAFPQWNRFGALTRRQMEVTGLMLCGMSVCETARLLHRSANTISVQRSEACKRLGFSGESEMYRYAAGHGLWLDRSSAPNESQIL